MRFVVVEDTTWPVDMLIGYLIDRIIRQGD